MNSEPLNHYPSVPMLEHIESERMQEANAEPKKPPVRYRADRHDENDTFYDKLYGLLTNGDRWNWPLKSFSDFRFGLWYQGEQAKQIREKYKWVETIYLLLFTSLLLFAYATQREPVADVYAILLLLSIPVAFLAFHCSYIFINCRTGSEDDR